MKYRTVELAVIDRDRPVSATNYRMNRISLPLEPPTQRLDALLRAIDAQTRESRCADKNVGVNRYPNEGAHA